MQSDTGSPWQLLSVAHARFRSATSRRLPLWLRIVLTRIQMQAYKVIGKTPTVLDGRLIEQLRPSLIDKFDLLYPCATTNCGLLQTSSGYLGIFKNGTFNFCWELGINVTSEVSDVRQALYLAEFDINCHLIRARLLTVNFGNIADKNEKGIFEDARIISDGHRVIVVVNHVPRTSDPESWPDQKRAWPFIGVLDSHSPEVTLHRLQLDGIEPPQKNWVPFSWNGLTLLQYSINPHRVLIVAPDTGECRDLCVSHFYSGAVSSSNFFKGGAPPIRIGNKLLGACHSWCLNGDGEREYFTYFYQMQGTAPFRIEEMTVPLKVLVKQRVQYLVGITPCEKDECVMVSYGVNDCDNYVVMVKLKDIFSLMKKPSCLNES